ncbi:LOW QUALITY PROTEIN: interleukin-17B [Tachyglossus aculeatus]|uniref:LOW QUALITY PROTEIN: interleukin-17B n=1 Tax=Tachyglossus aculeatus TaxID=9261 RepID=UPI0018F2E992|nr:LOW QUALITY PROTEIN: interleukin-17B [Tachyglossus aculeatus]
MRSHEEPRGAMPDHLALWDSPSTLALEKTETEALGACGAPEPLNSSPMRKQGHFCCWESPSRVNDPRTQAAAKNLPFEKQTKLIISAHRVRAGSVGVEEGAAGPCPPAGADRYTPGPVLPSTRLSAPRPGEDAHPQTTHMPTVIILGWESQDCRLFTYLTSCFSFARRLDPSGSLHTDPETSLQATFPRTVSRMDGSHNLLVLILVFVALMVVTPGEPRERGKGAKGKRKGVSRPKALSPENHRPSLDLVQRMNLAGERTYALPEDYDRSIQEMVTQLRNGSDLARNKCEVNLQLWLSNKRSLSPWAYSINHDPGRIPADLPEARCLCHGCINPFTRQEDRSMVSVPIYSKIPVRRRLCQAPRGAGAAPAQAQRKRPRPCRRELQTVMETVAVGCTCIF